MIQSNDCFASTPFYEECLYDIPDGIARSFENQNSVQVDQGHSPLLPTTGVGDGMRSPNLNSAKMTQIEVDLLQLALRDAVLLGDTTSIGKLTKSGVDPNHIDEEGDNLLHLAFKAHFHSDKSVLRRVREALINAGTDNHQCNNAGYSPTMLGFRLEIEKYGGTLF